MIRSCIALLLSAAAWSAEGGLVVADAWARATAPGAAAGGVFLAIRNPGAADDRLVAAACERAEVVELHTHQRGEDGVMRMRAVPAIAVPAGGAALLRPGAEHVMLIGLRRPLVVGERFDLVLTFAAAGTRTVAVTVAEATASAAPAPAPAAAPATAAAAATAAGCCGH